MKNRYIDINMKDIQELHIIRNKDNTFNLNMTYLPENKESKDGRSVITTEIQSEIQRCLPKIECEIYRVIAQ